MPLEIIVDLPARTHLAHVPKVVDDGSEERRGLIADVAFGRSQRRLHASGRLGLVQQLRVDRREELRVELQRLWNDFAICKKPPRDDFDLRERRCRVEDP